VIDRKNHRHIECEEGSGNVFADLGLEATDELFTRAQMGFHVYTILRDKKLKQDERVIMRLPESLLKAVKVKATRSGMPYQHFIR